MAERRHKPSVALAHARSAPHLVGERLETKAPRLTFDEVYAEYFRFVWRALRALGVAPSAVEDAAQDVFFVVHRRLPDFEGGAYLRTWLFAIAKRVASDYRRRRTWTFEDLSRADAVADRTPSPLDATARNEGVELIERALDMMEEHQRLVFFLMDIEELRASDVAELLSINRNTVYSRLNRARENFNQIVARLCRPDPPRKGQP